MQHLLIELQYLGSIRYYAKLLQYEEIAIEKCENFVKSTYRNRCYITGPNGRLLLSIPVKGGKSQHTKYSNIEIAYEEDWQKIHWQSLFSSYRRSPYFEFYEADFEPFYHRYYDSLFEFNWELMQLLIRLIGIQVPVSFTNKYEKHPSPELTDLRSGIHPNPKKELKDLLYQEPKYIQVFEERTGFIPNLSIVDLLFNQGPNTLSVLREAYSKG